MDISMNLEVAKIDKSTISPSDVFIVKIPFGKYTIETMQNVWDAFKYCFPDNQCMLIPDDCCIHIVGQVDDDFIPATQEELLKFLNIQKESGLYGQEVQN